MRSLSPRVTAESRKVWLLEHCMAKSGNSKLTCNHWVKFKMLLALAEPSISLWTNDLKQPQAFQRKAHLYREWIIKLLTYNGLPLSWMNEFVSFGCSVRRSVQWDVHVKVAFHKKGRRKNNHENHEIFPFILDEISRKLFSFRVLSMKCNFVNRKSIPRPRLL